MIDKTKLIISDLKKIRKIFKEQLIRQFEKDKVKVTNKDTGQSYEVTKSYYDKHKDKYDVLNKTLNKTIQTNKSKQVSKDKKTFTDWDQEEKTQKQIQKEKQRIQSNIKNLANIFNPQQYEEENELPYFKEQLKDLEKITEKSLANMIQKNKNFNSSDASVIVDHFIDSFVTEDNDKETNKQNEQEIIKKYGNMKGFDQLIKSVYNQNGVNRILKQRDEFFKDKKSQPIQKQKALQNEKIKQRKQEVKNDISYGFKYAFDPDEEYEYGEYEEAKNFIKTSGKHLYNLLLTNDDLDYTDVANILNYVIADDSESLIQQYGDKEGFDQLIKSYYSASYSDKLLKQRDKYFRDKS